MFALDSRLQQDCLLVGDFALSRLLLMNDANYPGSSSFRVVRK